MSSSRPSRRRWPPVAAGSPSVSEEMPRGFYTEDPPMRSAEYDWKTLVDLDAAAIVASLQGQLARNVDPWLITPAFGEEPPTAIFCGARVDAATRIISSVW